MSFLLRFCLYAGKILLLRGRGAPKRSFLLIRANSLRLGAMATREHAVFQKTQRKLWFWLLSSNLSLLSPYSLLFLFGGDS